MTAISPIRDRSAIVGIGTTAFARNLGMTERDAALEAIHAALDDAGISAQQVDAIFKVDMDSNNEADLARILGIPNLRAWGCAGWGGGAACTPVIQAALAIATGMAEVAIAFRARNRGSGGRLWERQSPAITGIRAFEVPYGLASPVQQIALSTRRYMRNYGVTPRQLAAVAVTQRANAAANPCAVFRDPITIDDVLNSRMVADPLHLLDCCPETDGACAVVLTSAERARDLRHPSILVSAVAQATGGRSGERMAQIYEDDPWRFPGEFAARDLYTMAGLGPAEVDVAMLYDMFTPVVLWQLESWGFCKRGEGGAFVESGGMAAGGTLPVNTHGGSLSEGYIHGFNHVLEAVRQLRGTSHCQVPDANVALVAAAPVVPTSALILRRAS